MSQQVEVTSSTSCEENHNASLYKRTKNQLNYLLNVARDQLLQQALDMMEIRPPPVQDCCPVYLRSLTHSRRMSLIGALLHTMLAYGRPR